MVQALFPFRVGMGGFVGFFLRNGVMVGYRCEWNVVEGNAVRRGVVVDGDTNLRI